MIPFFRLSRRPTSLGWLPALLLLPGCAADPDAAPDRRIVARPDDVPELHHVALNSVDPDAAIEWYLTAWPTAERVEVAGRAAVASEMYLLFERVAAPAPGRFVPDLGRSEAQSAIWHIGAFANTTDMDESLAGAGIGHLPLYLGPDSPESVWRSGLTPYSGIVTAGQLSDAEPAPARPGGFSYVLAPDDVLFEFTGGANATPSMSHVHLFHEQPQCAANWYLEALGMSLPPIRNEDGSTAARPSFSPCEATPGEAGWPSLEPAGTIRSPRGTAVFGNGSISFYPRQCIGARCDTDQPLVPSRGQVLDHVAFTVQDVEAWHAWLVAMDATVIEELHDFEGNRAFMIEGPDRIALELVGADGVPLPERRP